MTFLVNWYRKRTLIQPDSDVFGVSIMVIKRNDLSSQHPLTLTLTKRGNKPSTNYRLPAIKTTEKNMMELINNQNGSMIKVANSNVKIKGPGSI